MSNPKNRHAAKKWSQILSFSGFGSAFFRFHPIFSEKIRAGDVEVPGLYDGFPQLVPTSLFQQAQKLRTEKSQAYGGSLNPALKEIRSQICCHACGQTMHRRNLGSQDAILWQCPECRKEICLPDRELLDGLITAANRAISRPEQANAFQKDRGLLSITAMRLENEIRRELGNPKADTNRLLQMIQECAQEKYRVCSAENAWRTKEIFQMLSAMNPITSFQPQQ